MLTVGMKSASALRMRASASRTRWPAASRSGRSVAPSAINCSTFLPSDSGTGSFCSERISSGTSAERPSLRASVLRASKVALRADSSVKRACSQRCRDTSTSGMIARPTRRRSSTASICTRAVSTFCSAVSSSAILLSSWKYAVCTSYTSVCSARLKVRLEASMARRAASVSASRRPKSTSSQVSSTPRSPCGPRSSSRPVSCGSASCR